MKRIIIIIIVIFFICLSGINVIAAENNEENSTAERLYQVSGADKLYDALPGETKSLLKTLGVNKPSKSVISDVTFSRVAQGMLMTAKDFAPSVFASTSIILGVLLLYSSVEGLSGIVTQKSLSGVLSVVVALCVSAAISLPVCDIIKEANRVIILASDFMLSYIPVMLAVMIACGNSLSAASYYALMNSAAQVVSQLSSKLITPLLNVFLGLSLCNSVLDGINISGLLKLFSKTVKWLLSFSFTLFSALLTFKSMISSSVDNVSSRAVRYTMSTFIPVVGAALSEAYRTVRGSVAILKNGVGIFVIFAVALIFLPVVMKLLLWMLSVNLCKAFGEMLCLKSPSELLSGVSTVLSTLLATLFCIMALFIVSTALIMTIGGNVS